MGAEPDVAAGDFSQWIGEIGAAIRDERGSDVPCDGCTACCRSSQFIHIRPDETDTLSRIPDELKFAAPGRPRGHVVLGYDERGHCPMLIDDRCSIYEHRPNACRTYDCRIFPAAGLDAGADKPEITRRARRWQFGFSTPDDSTERDAVRGAASFLDAHADLVRGAGMPVNETKLAVLAIELRNVFLVRDEQTGRMMLVEPDPDVVRAALSERR